MAKPGVISVAFFGLCDPGRGPDDPLHIVPGEAGHTLVRRYDGPPVDFNRFLAGITIRYERPETLQERGAVLNESLLPEILRRNGLLVGE